MGRPRGFDEETVLDAAADAFIRGGYEGTSIDDLVQALKLHRGSLYKAFGSKNGLFMSVLRHYVRWRLPDAINHCSRPGGAGVAVLSDGGDLDLLLVAALERGPVDAQVAGLVRSALDDLEHALRRETDAVSPLVGAPRPENALNLLGARLYERLHRGLDEPGLQPLTTAKET